MEKVGFMNRNVYHCEMSLWNREYRKASLKRCDVKNLMTFVIQGPVNECTEVCIQSIRKFFCGSKIILSTWRGEPVPSSIPDLLIQNEDPGPLAHPFDGLPNNLSRQLISTTAGLAHVTTPLCVKLRSDIVFCSDEIVGLSLHEERVAEFSVSEELIAIPTCFTRNPRLYPAPFHPSDLLFFGLAKDIRNYFNAPLPDDTFRLDSPQNGPLLADERIRQLGTRFTPEQYLFLSYLSRNGKAPKCSHAFDCISKESLAVSEYFLLNNFLVKSPRSLGILLPKKFYRRERISNYTEADWAHLFAVRVKRQPHRLEGIYRESKWWLLAGILRVLYRMWFGSAKFRSLIRRAQAHAARP